MKTKIIGEKSKFAIEVKLRLTSSNRLYGNTRIWINNNPLGAIQEEIMMGSFINCLRIMKENSYNLLFSKHISLTENFDDFIIRANYKKENITFYWKLIGNNYEYNDINNKPYFYQKTISSIYFRGIIIELNKSVEKEFSKYWK
ncbi:hypothetical protein WAF17_19175 [Bernardetia sp. ABR2-2B]|uniref:hypothetical protein n=1 Tax=Bernardetia sp. ABR2-2B TaxID=3127472 RepID=UPI0030D2E433